MYLPKNYIKEGFLAERSFGILFSIVFLCVAFYPPFVSDSVYLWSLVFGCCFCGSGLSFPGMLSFLNGCGLK